MRSFNSPYLLLRHNVFKSSFLQTPSIAGVITPKSRASSLSAVHHGLRRSEKARPQGFAQTSLAADRSRRAIPIRTNGRQKDSEWEAPDFRIRRGKKDVTDKGPQPKSRRARFNDPNDDFGQNSLVKKLKFSPLRRELEQLVDRKRQPPRTSNARRDSSAHMTHDRFMSDLKSDQGERAQTSTGKSGRPRTRETTPGRTRSQARPSRALEFQPRKEESSRPRGFRDDSRPSHETTSDRARYQSRPTRPADYQPKREEFSRPRSPRDQPRSPRESFEGDKSVTQSRSTEGRQTDGRDMSRDNEPIRIHHTTAASQFLYGHSVVKAALKDSQRQLYNLYIYDGSDRRNAPRDDSVEAMAIRKGVAVTKVPDNVRMLDKMSGGRPHNGFVLEASPLPQKPVRALGSLSEDFSEPGFKLELAHQSLEEARVNGTSNFVTYQLPEGRNPFVLLLDSILDPQNLGAILRTAAFMGVNAVAITQHTSSTITPVALKASAGASEVLTLFSVNSTVDFLNRSKESGWLVYAAVADGPRSRGNSHLSLDRLESFDPLSSAPTILVVGNEGDGLVKQVRRAADHEVSIPSPSGFLGAMDSLNVSVATGVLCASFLKKQSSGVVEIEEEASREEKEVQSQLW